MSETRDLTPEDRRTPEELTARPPERVYETESGEFYDHPPAEPGELGLEGPPPLTEPDVRRWLDRLGRVAAWIVGRFTATPEDLEPPAWRFTEEELGELTPPATRVLNRRLLWMAGVIRNADEIELGFLLLEYVDGNLERVRAAREAAEATEAADAEAARTDLEPGHPERGPGSFGLGEDDGGAG